jgi:hypothetical protein
MQCNFFAMHVFTKLKAHWEGTKRNQDHKMFPLFQGNVYKTNHACKRAQGVANLEVMVICEVIVNYCISIYNI